jgi:hypothetical protein
MRREMALTEGALDLSHRPSLINLSFAHIPHGDDIKNKIKKKREDKNS